MIVSSFVLNRFRPTNNVKPLQDCTWEDIHNYLSTNQAVENVWKVGDTIQTTYDGDPIDMMLIGITYEYNTYTTLTHKTATFQFKQAISISHSIGTSDDATVQPYEYYFHNTELGSAMDSYYLNKMDPAIYEFCQNGTDTMRLQPYLYCDNFNYEGLHHYADESFKILNYQSSKLFLLTPYEMGIFTTSDGLTFKNDSALNSDNNPMVANPSLGVSSPIYEYYYFYSPSRRDPITLINTQTKVNILTRTGTYYSLQVPNTGSPVGTAYPTFYSVDITNNSTIRVSGSGYDGESLYMAPCFKII